ncbi:sigma-70 family RNA polymerase sigma factor [Streptomyces decoyicus]|uniref:RNA polymerase sigma factor n=1 Tax=Streptomyces decoyicus TaxID=249567 RepID=UPI002E199C21|nr:sigma-70 family RNA polymerase sigma factor [Streptomyces decoyicus]
MDADAPHQAAVSVSLVSPAPRFPPAPGESGARSEFAACYEQEIVRLTRFVMHLGAAPHEAADIAQSAFAVAFEQWESIQHPRAWLRTVAQRKMQAMRYPREELTDQLPDLPGGRCPVDAVELSEEEARVYEALSWLPDRQREVMAWTLDGYKPQEIARLMKVTPEAVRQNLHRGRTLLKRALLSPTSGGAR